jgi:hypothetical protein
MVKNPVKNDLNEYDDNNEIIISKNEISQNSKMGILIHSDEIHFNYFNKISILNNKISNNKINSIVINKLTVKNIEITNNEIKNNFDNGLCLTETKFIQWI